MSRRGKIALIVAGVLLLALLAGNQLLGTVLRDRIGGALGKRVDGELAVDIGSRPALFDLAERQIPRVSVSSREASTCRYRDFSFDAEVRGLSLGSPASFSSSHVSVGLTPETLRGVVAQRTPLAARLLTEMEPEPASGTLAIAAGPGGLMRAQLRPTLEGRTFGVELVGATVLGNPAPPALLRRLRDRFELSRTVKRLPLGLQPQSVAVDGEGIRVELAGGPGRFDPSKSARGELCPLLSA
jgi:DUF2993 family protein